MKIPQNQRKKSRSSCSTPLNFEEYRSRIRLDDPYDAPDPASQCMENRERIVAEILTHLKSEYESGPMGIDLSTELSSYVEKRRMLQALLTVRRPAPLPSGVQEQIDSILQRETLERGIVEAANIPRISDSIPATSYSAASKCALWQGDITTLRIDAIVNAANSDMLGCFHPFHACIDNVIHAAAGPRLREDCHAIMELQGSAEPTGQAKVTRAYNLPCTYVIHTVGPIHDSGSPQPSPLHEEQLAASYSSCLDLAANLSNIRSIAFCCISTGVFGFPQELAARIALGSVEEWLKKREGELDLVVFNVFQDSDLGFYERLLSPD